MGHFPLPLILTPHRRVSLSHRQRSPTPALTSHSSLNRESVEVEPQAYTAQVLCQPICRCRGVYGLESHMAVGPAGASTLLFSQGRTRLPSPLTSTKSNISSPGWPNRSRRCYSNWLTGPSPNARIRTLFCPLHPAVDPAPPPPSAAAAWPAQSHLP